MSGTRGTGSIPWNHWYEKTETSQLTTAFGDRSPLNGTAARSQPREGRHSAAASRWPRRAGDCSPATATAGPGDGSEALGARKYFRSRGNGNERRTVAAHSTSFRVNAKWLIGNYSNVRLKCFFTTAWNTRLFCKNEFEEKNPKRLTSIPSIKSHIYTFSVLQLIFSQDVKVKYIFFRVSVFLEGRKKRRNKKIW